MNATAGARTTQTERRGEERREGGGGGAFFKSNFTQPRSELHFGEKFFFFYR